MLNRAPAGVDWTPYLDLGAGVGALLRDMGPAEAERAYGALRNKQATRLQALSTLLRSQGIELLDRDESIQELNDWFVRNVEESLRAAGELAPIWYSVVNDVALYLGALLIKKTGVLRWVFEVGGDGERPAGERYETADSSLRPSLSLGVKRGTRMVSQIRLDGLIADYAHAVVAGQHVDPDYFMDLIMAGVASI